jgi:hypothetical protein
VVKVCLVYTSKFCDAVAYYLICSSSGVKLVKTGKRELQDHVTALVGWARFSGNRFKQLNIKGKVPLTLAVCMTKPTRPVTDGKVM